MNWTLFTALAVAALGFLGGVYAAIKSHRPALAAAQAAQRQADAALLAAQASAQTAQATAQAAVQDAFTHAYEAADAHWARYNEGMQRWNESLATQVAENSRRLRDAETRGVEAQLRASKSDALYKLAIIYLHSLASWFAEILPGERLPPPPPQLAEDLGVAYGK